MLKAARSLDQPSTPRQSRSSKSNEMASSAHQNEIEKLHINSENQEKDMVEILEGLHQRHRRQSHVVEKGQNDQSKYNAKELKGALMVVKKMMKMDAAEPFNTPVDPVALGIPDYFDIIDTPMNLGTVCSALKEIKKEEEQTRTEAYADMGSSFESSEHYGRTLVEENVIKLSNMNE